MKEVWNMYARELRSCLQCSRTQKNAFLRETKRLAVDYLAGISEPSIEDLIEFLGTPEETGTFLSGYPRRAKCKDASKTNRSEAGVALCRQFDCTGWRYCIDPLLYAPFRPLA